MSQDNFSSTLDLFKGYWVNLYVSEEIIKGKLMGVEEDHLILENENNYIFYYSLDKIQAITKNTKQFQAEEISSKYLKTTSLKELLDSLINSWVSILCLNKQTFSGIVNEVDSDFVTLISGEERILIKLTHVSNIVMGVIEDNSNNSDSETDEEEQNEEEQNEEEQNETEVTYQYVELEDSSNESNDIVEEVTGEKVEHIKEESPEISSQSTSDNSQSIVWSQSIRPTTVENFVTEVLETSNEKEKSSKSNRDSSSSKQEKSKKSSKSSSKNSKSKSSSKKEGSSKKEVSETKVEEVKQEVNSEKTNKEVTALKFADTANIFGLMKEMKEIKESKKETNSKDTTSAMNLQQDEESRLIRFAGEPITRDSKEAFPYAGWPSRRNRANRF
ncbi:hypothetical protein BIV60_07915 [Bacillus sp. MUM 116]|uniref:hypothetical protein n=1 Tax=Bacillus sp. MUM 116 TaxID=1678002 RepID=UPI0008F5BADA|nr:hypothetical protein [Bacillus sp. MUM 116]OIK15678.1 hypothetical protein BIV60_07915 [Bacillus sp. MUM 116]